MAIFYPDILQHNNPTKPLVNITEIQGTAYPLGSLSETGSIPSDKRQIGQIIYVSGSSMYYSYYGQTTSSGDWNNTSNWRTFATLSGSFTGSFSGSFTGVATTSSYVLPLVQNVEITGSLKVTGSLYITGSIKTTGSTNLNLVDGDTWLKSIVARGTSAASSAYPNDIPFVRFSMRNDVSPNYGFLQAYSVVPNGSASAGFTYLKIEGRPIIFSGTRGGDAAYFDRSGSFVMTGNKSAGWGGGWPDPFIDSPTKIWISGSVVDPLKVDASGSFNIFYLYNNGNVNLGYNPNAIISVTGSLNAPTITGSLFGLASSASYVTELTQDVSISGDITASNALFTGTITAQRLNVQYITSSVIYVTGSTKFGTELTDAHQFTGSLYITGSINSSAVISASAFSAAGITGSVQFNNNGFISGSNYLVWDSVNNRLGINNSIPLSLLSISHGSVGGDSSYTKGIRITNTSSGRSWIITGGVNGISDNAFGLRDLTEAKWKFVSNVGTFGINVENPSSVSALHVVGNGATSSTYTAQFHNSTGTSNSLVIRDDGNVSIGGIETIYTSKLYVNGNVRIQDGNGIGNANLSSGESITFNSVSGLISKTAGVIRMWITSGGNVGIGTSNPTSIFQIGSNVGGTGGAINATISSNSLSEWSVSTQANNAGIKTTTSGTWIGGYGSAIPVYMGSLANAGGSVYLNYSNNGVVKGLYITHNNGSPLWSMPDIRGEILHTPVAFGSNATADIYLSAHAIQSTNMAGVSTNQTFDTFSIFGHAVPTSSFSGTSSSRFFRVNFWGNSNSSVTSNNNTLVQIGAITKSELRITAQGAGLNIYGTTVSSSATITTTAGGGNLNLRSDIDGSGAGGGINYHSSQNGLNHSHRWYHNVTEQMRLSTAGYLGIGTTTPSSKLDLSHTGSGMNTIFNSNLSYGTGVSGNYVANQISASYGAGSTGNLTGLKIDTFNSGSGGNYALLVNGGNVGIGTNAPSYKLHISGAIGDGIKLDGVSSVGLLIQAGDLAGGTGTVQLYAGNNNNSYLRLASEYIREGGNGGLGIGVAREDIISKFQVVGTGATSSTKGLLIQNSNLSSSLTVLDDGNVGIGTITPTSKLTIGTDVGYTGTLYVGSSGTVATRIANFGNVFEIVTNESVGFVGQGISVAGVNRSMIFIGAYITSDNDLFKFKSSSPTTAFGTPTSGIKSFMNIGEQLVFAPTSGNATYNLLNLTSTLNTTGTYSGIARGIYYNPTISGNVGLTHNAFESTSGHVVIGGNSQMLILTGSGKYIQTPTYGNNTILIGVDAAASYLHYEYGAKDLHIGSNGSGNTLFKSTGNVGIGLQSLSPVHKLDVSGSGRFTSNLTVSGSLVVSGSIRALTPTSSSYLCVGILTSDYSVSPEEDVVINFVAQIDPNSWWDGPKFTPTIPGYYNINFGAWFENIGVSGNQVNIQVRKSGTAQMISQVPSNNVVSQSLFCSKIIYMNGDTDWLDFTAWHPGSTDKLLLRGTADGSGTWFSANFLGI